MGEFIVVCSNCQTLATELAEVWEKYLKVCEQLETMSKAVGEKGDTNGQT